MLCLERCPQCSGTFDDETAIRISNSEDNDQHGNGDMSGSLPPFMPCPNVKDCQASVHSKINAVFSSWTDGLP